MSAIVTLGSKPKNFKKAIQINIPESRGGGEAPLVISYIYRTRREHAELLDENHRTTEQRAKAVEDEVRARFVVPEGEVVPAHQIACAVIDALLADQVLMVADGWDLVNPFDRASLLELEDTYPGALRAIIEPYGGYVAEARAKN